MNSSIRRKLAVGTAVVATAALSACSSGSDDSSEATPTAVSSTAAANLSVDMANLLGPGCPAYATQVPTGKGSIEAMANDPLMTATANNPMLKTLTQALTGKLNADVDLKATLNGQEYTVFAPVDTAFAQVSGKRMNKLKKDDKALVNLLTYHVVAGELAPAKVLGKQVTVQGGEVNVTGKGSEIKVNAAHVICGGIKTANATVYLIDKVLDPEDAA
jgi:uncharacterized surface protein with fasciclin (FAS1) repeats